MPKIMKKRVNNNSRFRRPIFTRSTDLVYTCAIGILVVVILAGMMISVLLA